MKDLLIKDFSNFLKEEASRITFCGLNEQFGYNKKDGLWEKVYTNDELLPQVCDTEKMIDIVALKMSDDIFISTYNPQAGFDVQILYNGVSTVRIVWYESVKMYNQSYPWPRFSGSEFIFEIKGEKFKYNKDENGIWVLEADELPAIDFQGLNFQKELTVSDFEKLSSKYQAYMILKDNESLATIWNGKRLTKKEFEWILPE
jgi:hypothetical protein